MFYVSTYFWQSGNEELILTRPFIQKSVHSVEPRESKSVLTILQFFVFLCLPIVSRSLHQLLFPYNMDLKKSIKNSP